MRLVQVITASAVLLAAPAGAEDLRGQVRYSGPPAGPVKVADSKARGCGADPVFDLAMGVGEHGELQDALVWIASGVPASPPATAPLAIDQVACRYVPRVAVALPGQKIVVKNSQGVLHNVHAKVNRRTKFNKGQPAGAAPVELVARANEPLVQLGCDIHPWMRSYIHVLPHGFAAVTAQDGSFTIRGLSPGRYTLRAWHARLGQLEVPVTVSAGAAGQAVTVTYPAGPAKPRVPASSR